MWIYRLLGDRFAKGVRKDSNSAGGNPSIYRIRSLHIDDGDHLVIVIRTDGDSMALIDEGHAYMRLPIGLKREIC